LIVISGNVWDDEEEKSALLYYAVFYPISYSISGKTTFIEFIQNLHQYCVWVFLNSLCILLNITKMCLYD
jgi:hypothetical protein